MVNGRMFEVLFLEVSKFIFQRPDNKKMILEIDHHLYEEEPNKLFLLNQTNVEYFKTLIQQHYDEKMNQTREGINQLVKDREAQQEKIKQLQTSLALTEKKIN